MFRARTFRDRVRRRRELFGDRQPGEQHRQPSDQIPAVPGRQLSDGSVGPVPRRWQPELGSDRFWGDLSGGRKLSDDREVPRRRPCGDVLWRHRRPTDGPIGLPGRCELAVAARDPDGPLLGSGSRSRSCVSAHLRQLGFAGHVRLRAACPGGDECAALWRHAHPLHRSEAAARGLQRRSCVDRYRLLHTALPGQDTRTRRCVALSANGYWALTNMFRQISKLLPAVALLAGTVSLPTSAASNSHAASTATSPISHVVVLMQENHSFDNVLGRLCVQSQRCDGATVGLLHDGSLIPLPAAENIVPGAPHNVQAMTTAIDGGRMDGFDLMVTPDHDCASPSYDCYQAFDPSQIPNLAALALSFAISDRTFQSDLAASWGSHLGLVSATLDGFTGDNPCAGTQCPTLAPQPAPVALGTGWGCDSHRDALWRRAADGRLRYH